VNIFSEGKDPMANALLKIVSSGNQLDGSLLWKSSAPCWGSDLIHFNPMKIFNHLVNCSSAITDDQQLNPLFTGSFQELNDFILSPIELIVIW
jgi:hypothetical protein